MKVIKLLLIGFVILISFSADLPGTFIDLLNRSSMTFEKPTQMEEVKIRENKGMNYEYALKYVNKNFEVRYAIRPLDERLKDYEEDEKRKELGVINFHPNKMYLASFKATLYNISDGQRPIIKEFSAQAVKKEFNADWGAFTIVEVNKEFAQDYKYAFAVAIHKDNASDAYYFYLSDNKENFNTLMQPIFHSLKFK